MNMVDGEITTLTKASTKGDSLRTTVPMSMVKLFELKELSCRGKSKHRKMN